MNQIKAVFNGEFNYLENIKISPFSRAYTFSDSIYEVIPFYKNNIIAFEAHLNRLQASSDALNIKIKINKISLEIQSLISSCDSDRGYVYYQVTRGKDLIRSHIYLNDLEVETFGYVTPFTFETKSLKVMVCSDDRWGRCDIKSTSLLSNVLNTNEAKEKSCDEIIMHRNNILTEAGASNLFFIKDGQVCTPSLSNNILPGITRSILISALSEANINVLEGNFSLYDLQQASSAWLTSSTKGIAPIKDILNVEHTLDHNDNFYLECKKIFDVKFFS